MTDSKELIISFVQFNIIWQDREANIRKVEELLESTSIESDVIILPEMFTTGFSVSETSLFEDINDSPTLLWMKTIAKRKNSAICGSFAIHDSGKHLNRMFFVEPDGSFKTYDKKHLFRLSVEPKYYSSGTSRTIVDFRGWKINLAICYDLRFPVWLRNRYHNDQYEYDILLISANWPSSRIKIWKTLLAARSIENQCYTIGVNRIGNDGNSIPHNGFSMICDWNGDTLVSSKEKEGLLSTKLTKASLEKQRITNTFAADWDSYKIY